MVSKAESIPKSIYENVAYGLKVRSIKTHVYPRSHAAGIRVSKRVCGKRSKIVCTHQPMLSDWTLGNVYVLPDFGSKNQKFVWMNSLCIGSDSTAHIEELVLELKNR